MIAATYCRKSNEQNACGATSSIAATRDTLRGRAGPAAPRLVRQERVKPLVVQQLIQPAVEGMARRTWQIRRRHPQAGWRSRLRLPIDMDEV